MNKKWYQKPAVIIISLFLFFPLGIYLMWTYSQWNKQTKWAVTTGILILYFIFNLTSIDTSSESVAGSQDIVTTTESPIPSDIPDSPVLVTRVIDGDTIELETGQIVRYIGIDTPEPSKSECYSSEATQRNKELVDRNYIRLEKDTSETDRYDRLLRYVYTEDGQFINDTLVKEGFAESSSYPPDTKYQDQFDASEAEAQKSRIGIWSDTCSSGELSTTAIPTIQSSDSMNGSQNDTTDTTSISPNGDCNIKGNVNSDGEKIYHYPGCQSYTQTKITPEKGERWFCTIQEAQDAGWQVAGNC